MTARLARVPLILLFLRVHTAAAQTAQPQPPLVPPPPPRRAEIRPSTPSDESRVDTLELKTGEHVQGKFKRADSSEIVMEVAGQPIAVSLEKVKAIYFGAVPNSAPMAAPSSSVLQEALDGLKALRSVTNSGIAYRDYAQRVLDARVKVDRYLSLADKGDVESGHTRAVRVAMLEYELASQAWLTKIDPPHGDLWRPMGTTMQDPEVAKCPIVKASTEFVDNPPPPAPSRSRFSVPSKPMERVDNLGLTLSIAGGSARVWPSGTTVSAIWACAAEQIKQAEM
jgi:hypothetical protein